MAQEPPELPDDFVALQKWRFYPAIDAGKPVASTAEIRFTLSASSAGGAPVPNKKGEADPRPWAT